MVYGFSLWFLVIVGWLLIDCLCLWFLVGTGLWFVVSGLGCLVVALGCGCLCSLLIDCG